MEKIEAYQTSDGKKFFKEEQAKNHEIQLKYRENKEKIEDHLFDLVGIETFDLSGIKEDKFYKMIEGESFGYNLEEVGIAEFIIDMITFLDGALLKTAEYAKEMIEFEQFKQEGGIKKV